MCGPHLPSPLARGDTNHGFESAAEGRLIGESRLLSDFTERAVCPREQQFRALDSLPDQVVVAAAFQNDCLNARVREMAHRQAALAKASVGNLIRAIQMFPEQIDHSPLLPGRQASTRARDTVHRG